MSEPARGALGWLWLAAGVVVLDRVTKLWALSVLDMHRPVAVLPSLNLTLTRNTGAAFSLLSEAGGWQRWLFTGLASVIALVLVGWLARLPAHERGLAPALALVLGGALGNLWDRVSEGSVVDFVDLYFRGWHWPAFNVADAAITLGAGWLLWHSLRRPE